jgi:aspartate/methionine/tyrosine aminotransferase
MSAKSLSTLDLSGGAIGAVPPPDCVMKAISAGDHEPGVPGGDPELREAIASELLEATGFAPPPEQVAVVDGGCTEALELAFDYCSSGGRLFALFSPAWPGYVDLAQTRAQSFGEFFTFRSNNYLPDPEALEPVFRDISRSCAAVVVTHYATPCGTCMSEEHARELGETILRLPGRPVVIEDCLFWKNSFDRRRLPTLARIVPELWEEERLIGVTSVSKAWALGEQDVGFVWGRKAFRNFARRASRRSNLVPSAARQRGIRQAFSPEGLRVPGEVVAVTKRNLRRLRALTKDTSFELACVPQGGINALVDVRRLIHRNFRGRRICCENCLANMLEECYGVELCSGADFGCRFAALRVNLASAPEAEFGKAMERLRQFDAECS